MSVFDVKKVAAAAAVAAVVAIALDYGMPASLEPNYN